MRSSGSHGPGTVCEQALIIHYRSYLLCRHLPCTADKLSAGLSGENVTCGCCVCECVWELIKFDWILTRVWKARVKVAVWGGRYSACVIWKCGHHDTRRGTYYAAIIQACGLNLTAFYHCLTETRICFRKSQDCGNTLTSVFPELGHRLLHCYRVKSKNKLSRGQSIVLRFKTFICAAQADGVRERFSI